MSDGSSEGPQEDPELHVTPIERKPVKRGAEIAAADEEERKRQEAEKAQQIALAAEVALANQREIAGLVARNHAYIEHAVEMAKINAKKREERERIDILVVPDGSSKRRDPIVLERKAATKVTVGLVIAFILLVIGVIVGGIYYLLTQNNSPVAAPGTPGVIASADLPITGAVGESKPADKTQTKPAGYSANLSRGALPGNDGKSAADSDTHIAGNIVSPANPPETAKDPDTEIDDPAAKDKDAQKVDP